MSVSKAFPRSSINKDYFPKSKRNIAKMDQSEEWNNFMHRVTEVTSLVKDLTGPEKDKADRAQKRAEQYINGTLIVDEDVELKVKTDRTVVNKKAFESKPKSDGDNMDPETFMAEVSRDAEKRYQEKKIRREKADTFKTQATKAFRRGDYEKALSCYNKAIEQIKDDCLLYTDRALTLIKLGRYDKVLYDCEWASRVNKNSFKAQLYRTKAYKELEETELFEQNKEILLQNFSKHSDLIEYFLNKKYNDDDYE